MTDPLSPEFLEFSEMLDFEDELDESALNEDGRILLDLRTALREEPALGSSVPIDAKEMAESVLRTYSHQPLFTRGRLGLERALLRSVLSNRSGWMSGGLVAASLLAIGLFKPFLTQLLGWGLLASSLGWLAWRGYRTGERFEFMSTPEMVRQAIPGWVVSLVFYTIPVLSVLFCGVAFGSLFSLLESSSYGSMDGSKNEGVVGVLATVGLFCLLVSALRPCWKVFRENSGGNRWSLFGFQIAHAIPLVAAALTLVFIASSRSNSDKLIDPFYDFLSSGSETAGSFSILVPLMVLSAGLGLWVLLISTLSPKNATPRPVSKALRRSFLSLVLSSLPIVISVWGFYQLHLTPEIKDQRAYRDLVQSSEAWLKERRSVPDQENGWIELRPYFVKPEQDIQENMEVANRLGALGKLLKSDTVSEGWAALNPQEFDIAKAEFLKELPRIESSMKKPKFSVIATEGFGFEKMVPNYILYRNINQGLALLAEEALGKGDLDSAVDFATLGVVWANKDDSGILIEQMIRLACLKFALQSYESLSISGRLDGEQLNRLRETLRDHSLPVESFGQSMRHDVYAAELALSKYRDGGFSKESKGAGFSVMELVPTSYIESERKAYLNFSLTQVQDWDELVSREWLKADSISPYNLLFEFLVPNTARASIQFRAVHSQESAMGLVLALEAYRQKHQEYPESLEELVPNILPELPKDAMQPQRWSRKPGFVYQRIKTGYQLISSSEDYTDISLKRRQVFDSQQGWLDKKR